MSSGSAGSSRFGAGASPPELLLSQPSWPGGGKSANDTLKRLVRGLACQEKRCNTLLL